MNQGGYLYTAAKAAVTHITRAAGVQLAKYVHTSRQTLTGGYMVSLDPGDFGQEMADHLEFMHSRKYSFMSLKKL